MPNLMSSQPRCIVIAGPNGAGKTTFAQEFLLKDAGIARFVNADLIAAGISPLDPNLATSAAARLFLAELDRLANLGEDFSFETTMSGMAHLTRLRRFKDLGYRVEIVFLKLNSPELAIKRVAERVKHGGHDVPQADILRRFRRGWLNFCNEYRLVSDSWTVYDNSTDTPIREKETDDTRPAQI